MLKRITLGFISLCLAFGVEESCAKQPTVKLSTGGKEHINSLIYTGKHFVFQGLIDHLGLSPESSEGDFISIEIEGFFASGELGYPALPSKSMLFEAGSEEVTRISIDHLDSVIFDLNKLGISSKISPVKASVRKGASPEPFRLDLQRYNLDAWLGGPVFTTEYEGVMRGLQISTLHFSPVKYNPARNLVKVYYNVGCTLETREAGKRELPSPEAFARIFQRVVRQSKSFTKKAMQVEDPMTMVILSDTIFRRKLQPFVAWKTHKGFHIVEAYTQDPEVGSTRESIKSYLQELYTHPTQGVAPPTYLVIIGDVEQIPLSQSSGQITDLYYTTFDGEADYIPDLFYGRISVATEEQLQAVLDKILEYEQYQFPDPSFLDEAVLIAGVDGTFAKRHGNGQINYASAYYLNPLHNINDHTFLYPESGTSDSLILDLISGGVGFVNYTGHGLYDRWMDPTFHQNDIPQLQNLGKYPVMIGNGCETNIYNLGECFAEALLRAPQKGALAYIGCTNDSYWDEDYFWSVGLGPIVADPVYEETSVGYYDKVFHSHGEPRELWTPSLGEMIFGGNMSVQQSNSSRKKFYWEIYQLAGDPSIVPWFSQPGEREVLYPGVLPVGSNRMDVTCAPYDYIALSKNGVLLDALHASAEGFATLYFPDTLTGGTLDLVATGDLYRPFSGKVEIGIPADPYLDLLKYGFSNESVENDGLISDDEELSFKMQWINRGSVELYQDTLILCNDQKDISLLDSMVILANLGAGDTLAIQDVFRIRSGQGAVDQAPVLLGMYRKGDKENRKIYMKEKINSPVLISGGITWDDRPSGNGNGIVNPGEWLECEWILINAGHYRTRTLRGGGLQGGISGFEQIEFDSLPGLEPGSSTTISFRAQVADPANGLHRAGPFFAGDQYYSIVDSFLLYPGRHFVDFNRGSLDNYPFLNSATSPWISDPETYTSSMYSLRSGPVPNFGSSGITIEMTTSEPDTISFSYKVSSEQGYDYLQFFVDSSLVKNWSGEEGWNHYTHPIGQGNHVVTWSYEKDQSISRGKDAAWIDDIVFPISSFRKTDLSLMKIIQPVSGPWLTSREEVRLQLKNVGADTIQEFSISVGVDELPLVEESISIPIYPGFLEEISLSVSHDLSALGKHHLQASVHSAGDQYLGNNKLESDLDRTSFPDLALSLDRLKELDGIKSEAIIAIENAGNIPIDSLRFELWLDGILKGSGSRYLGLESGQMVHDTFRLVDSVDNLFTTGFHTYLVKSVASDSLMSNDAVSGTFYWHSLGTQPDPVMKLMLYPNPAREAIHLNLGQPAGKKMKIELVTSDGKVEDSYYIEKGLEEMYIPVSQYVPGNYVLYCEDLNLSLPVVIAE